MNPILPVLILVLGAGVMLVGALTRSRRGLAALAPVAATSLAVFGALALGLRLPSQATLSAWPEALFGGGLTLLADRVSWLFVMATLVAASGAFLTGLSRPGGLRLGPRTASLLITAAGAAAMMAQNLITLAVTWAVLDAVYFLSLLLLARGQNIERQATLSLTFNSVATFCVLAAGLDTLHNGQDAFLIGNSRLTDAAVLLILLAVLFRSGVFPLHLGLSQEDAGIRQGLGTLLRLVPAAVALDLLTHLAAASPDLPLKPWLSLAAGFGLLVGALQLWEAADPRHGIGYMTLANSSLAFLAALWGGPSASAGVLAIGLATVLGGAVLFLNNGFNEAERAWALPSLVAAFVLIGGPLTVGFLGAVVVYSGLLASGGWLLFIVCVAGQSLLTASYMRLVLWPGEPIPNAEPFVRVAYLFGLAAPLLFALIGGVAAAGVTRAAGTPPVDLLSAGSLVAAGAVVVGMLAGVGVWRFEAVIRERAESTWRAAAAAARLGWFYSLLWDLYRFIGRILRTTAAILEGEGAVLWTLVAALLVWLLFRGR